jgi:hypothetical protein
VQIAVGFAGLLKQPTSGERFFHSGIILPALRRIARDEQTNEEKRARGHLNTRAFRSSLGLDHGPKSMNTHQLEELVQRQRSIITFAQAAWDQVQEENNQLKQIITELQIRLEAHGISSETTPIDSADQLALPFTVTTNRRPAG